MRRKNESVYSQRCFANERAHSCFLTVSLRNSGVVALSHSLFFHVCLATHYKASPDLVTRTEDKASINVQ